MKIWGCWESDLKSHAKPDSKHNLQIQGTKQEKDSLSMLHHIQKVSEQNSIIVSSSSSKLEELIIPNSAKTAKIRWAQIGQVPLLIKIMFQYQQFI